MRTPRGRSTDVATILDRRQSPLNAGARADTGPPEMIPAADREMVLRGLEQVRNGELATEDDIQATLARYRL